VSTRSKTRRPSTVTPILLKTSAQTPWPEDERLFYLLGCDGLYLCREHEFFRSCVKTTAGPSELAAQQPFFEPRFPTIPRPIIERAVGFFARVAELHGSEAAALLVWDRPAACVRLVVPQQTATVSESAGGYRYPIGVHYEPPPDLPEEWVVFGDIHCHVNHAAYASHTDIHDELHSAGLHIVVGRIQNEPPEIHVEAVVDGERFVLAPKEVIAAYESRRMRVPKQWLDRVEVDVERYQWSSYVPIRGVN